MISVEIRDEQEICSLNHRAIRSFLKEAIQDVRPGRSCRLSLAMVEDEEISHLNSRYLGKAHATDVLAFSQEEGRALQGDETLLGDIMISTEMARRNASRFQVSLEKELALYLVHGLLHLFGYDDKTPETRQQMRREEERLLEHCQRTVALASLVKP